MEVARTMQKERTASSRLEAAEKAQEEGLQRIRPEERPLFHLTPPVGWMNDPNGFSFYQGKFHLFFQYNPYSTSWDTMHWGHAVSCDLLDWDYLPPALAPDRPCDEGGCFSGCAAELPDGRMALLYTGLMKPRDPAAEPAGGEFLQVQCLAVGDGIRFQKCGDDPVIGPDMVPDGISRSDFRDPKILRLQDGTYLALVSGKDRSGYGRILMYRSRDCLSWEYWKPLACNDGRCGKQYGTMWECPDFFELDGRWVLLISPMEMLPEEGRYPNGHACVALIGDFDDRTGTFRWEEDQPVDCGIDFYAAQTVLSPDGRRILVGWMQNWATIGMHREDLLWAGQMSLPRELFFRAGHLCQRPVRELALRYVDEVYYKKVPVAGEVSLYGVEGRTIDLETAVSPVPGEEIFRWFCLRFAMDGDCHTDVFFYPWEDKVRIDRHSAGSRQALVHERTCRIAAGRKGHIRMRLILDRFSFELFINDGESVMTAVIYTDLTAEKICFLAEGRAFMDVTKRSLRSGS